MWYKQRRIPPSFILAVLLACVLPVTVLATDPLIGGSVNVSVGGPGGPVGGSVNANVGGTGTSANAGSSTGSTGGARVDANVGVGNGNTGAGNTGGNSVANVDAHANVGGNGNASSNGNAGPSNGVANVDANVNVGGNSNAPANGSNGNSLAGVDANVTVGGTNGNPSGSLATVDACVQVAGACNNNPATATSSPSLVTGNACVVIDGACTTPPTTPSGTNPIAGVNACVAVAGSCNGTTPGSTGITIGGTVTTPIGGVGACVVILDSCTGTTPGGPTTTGNPIMDGNPTTNGNPAPNGTTPNGTTPIGSIPTGTTPGGPITIVATGDGSIFANGAGVQVNANAQNNPALCTIPLTAFSKDATMTSTLADCATVHITGTRASLPAGYGPTQDFAAAGASTKTLAGTGRLLTDVSGTCAGCETAFGSGSGYRSYVRLQDAASGDFIDVGIAHDTAAAATGDNAGALTLVIETGRKTASGYDLSQGYIATTTNRVPDGHAQILLAWTPQGVTVSVNGVVLPNETAARPATVGTYAVRMSQPTASFAAVAKNPGERVDSTFKSISFG